MTPEPDPKICPHCAELGHADCYRAGREDAAEAVRNAMRAESDRLAAEDPSAPVLTRDRRVSEGVGVAKVMGAVIRAARGSAGSDERRDSDG